MPRTAVTSTSSNSPQALYTAGARTLPKRYVVRNDDASAVLYVSVDPLHAADEFVPLAAGVGIVFEVVQGQSISSVKAYSSVNPTNADHGIVAV